MEVDKTMESAIFSVLCISVTVISSLLLFVQIKYILHGVPKKKKLGGCAVFVGHSWTDLETEDKAEFARILSEVITWLAVMVLSVYCLLNTSLCFHPFSYHDDITLIIIALCINVGRHIAGLILATATGSRESILLLAIHHVSVIAVLTSMIEFEMNFYLGLLGVFLEPDRFLMGYIRIFRKKRKFHYFSAYLLALVSTDIIGLVVSVLCRVILPIAVFIRSITAESPLVLLPIPLGFLCFAALFFLAYNSWTVYTWASFLWMDRKKYVNGAEFDCNVWVQEWKFGAFEGEKAAEGEKGLLVVDPENLTWSDPMVGFFGFRSTKEDESKPEITWKSSEINT